jgi:ferrochelatase
VEPTLQGLADAGHRHVLVAPVGFLSDHVEVNYDIDIEFRTQAAKLGLRLERTPMLNATEPMVDVIVALVDEALTVWP